MEYKNTNAAEILRNKVRAGVNPGMPLHRFMREINADRLDNVAMITEQRSYTYRQMFRLWDCYAEGLAGLHIDAEHGSRAMILYPGQAETVSIFFALNRLGVTVSFVGITQMSQEQMIIENIKREKITDLFDMDFVVSPSLIYKLMRQKEELSLQHIVIISSPDMEDLTAPERMAIEMNRKNLHSIPGIWFMEDLLKQYRHIPVSYTEKRRDFMACITHTSGTTKGIRKPVPLTNKQIIAASAVCYRKALFEGLEGRARLMLNIDISVTFMLIDQLMVSFAYGCTLVFNYLGNYAKNLGKLIGKYKIDVWNTMPMIVDLLMKTSMDIDLSSVKVVIMGGAAASTGSRKRYNQFLKQHGSSAKVQIGYGLSEVGGACTLTEPGDESDSVGFPFSGFDMKLQDEETKEFYNLSDGEREGILYIAGVSVSNGMLDSVRYYQLTKIDGKSYFCTNDLFKVCADGSLIYRGRMNQFFTNNEGVRFNAGLIENEMVHQKNVENCVILPAYDKKIHDTVPVMYVQLHEKAFSAKTVHDALCAIFIEKGAITKTNLPVQVMVVDHFPMNQSGKVDRFQINMQTQNGVRWLVRSVYQNEVLKDVVLQPTLSHDLNEGELPEELKKQQGESFEERLKNPAEILNLPPFVVSVAQMEFL